MTTKQAYERQLAQDVGGFAFDPLGFVLYAFPWGEGALGEAYGPEPWQREELEAIGAALRAGAAQEEIAQGESTLAGGERAGGELEELAQAKDLQAGAVHQAILRAISSGHGIGKSAFVAWVILWAMSTLQDTRAVVTANTEAQLKGKTWAELAKWHRLCLCGHWFECTATALIAKASGHAKTWRCDMVPWSERSTEAFAGLHNKGRRVLLIFDEASAIPDSVWEVSEGALTDADTEIIWIVCGNPTRNSGRFKECFGRLRHRWGTRAVDSRTVSLTNKGQIQKWVDDYGEDSDFVRVRVRGVFPRAGSNQLIPAELIETAAVRSLRSEIYRAAPLVFGLDVARFGDDQSVLTKRQGLYTQPQLKWRGLDLMTLAGIVAQHIDKDQPDAVFIDMGGLGAGVVDRLHQLGYDQVVGIDFGGSACDPTQHANKRTEMWCAIPAWLKNGGALPPDPELAADLSGPEYGFTGDKGQMILEKKADMKKRGLASPDCGDSLALTFAQPVARRQDMSAKGKAKTEYDLWEYGRC